jgi:TrmH family RNA methyltransferase
MVDRGSWWFEPAATLHDPPPAIQLMRIVTSRQNPIVRVFRDAAETPDASGGRLLLDGAHLVRAARDVGVTFEVVAVASSSLDRPSEEGALAQELAGEEVDVVAAADHVLDVLSPVKSPSGIVAIARRTMTTAADVCAADRCMVLAAADVQDPGNVGSLLRAAEAGGVTGAFICGRSANPFSWKALRGGMGSSLRLPLVAGMTTASVLDCMSTGGLRIVAAVPRGGQDPDAIDWRGRVGLIVGGEGPGLPDDVVDRCDVRVTIPMAPAVESLNVAVAAAILIYTARRQRT